jgi:hypothetical protein
MTHFKEGPLVTASDITYLSKKIRGKRFLRELYLNVKEDIPISKIPKGSVFIPSGFKFKPRK